VTLRAAAALAAALVVGACSATGPGAASRAAPPPGPAAASSTAPSTTAAPGPPSSTSVATTPTTPPTPTTQTPPTTEAPVPSLAGLPPIPEDGPVRAIVTPSGVVAAVLGPAEDGRWLVRLPCSGEGVATGTPLTGAHVVLDPGHGGDEEGALGPNGLKEKDVNLAVAERAAALLEDAGATVVLTRTSDYRISLLARAEIAVSLGTLAFVSVHHNAVPDGPRDGPGTETYYQVASADSRRLAGLLYEEVTAALGRWDVDWVGDTDAGAKYRLAGDGGDYYGILRRTAGVPAALVEGAFLSNPPEADLLARPEVQEAEAAAVARAIGRFLTGDDPGSGFVEPYARTEPAGPGGGSTGCVDPPLG
jgi:N-acetylmuramoyl-L-alanine amidase